MCKRGECDKVCRSVAIVSECGGVFWSVANNAREYSV